MAKGLVVALGAALLLATAGAPAGAQQFSDSYKFLKAVKDRDGDAATAILNGPNTSVINTRESGSGQAPLHIVAREKDLVWLNFLLSKGARSDVRDGSGETALTIAAQLGWVEGAKVLLARRAAVDVGNARGETALMMAVQQKNLPMVRLLLSQGANPDKTDNVTGLSAREIARRDPRPGPILKLIEENAVKPQKQVAGPKL